MSKKPKDGIELPYTKWSGEWKVLEKKEYGPATAIREDNKMGVATSAPVRGRGDERHEIRRIAVLLFRDLSEVITLAYFDYIHNARKWVPDWEREVEEMGEEEWMDSDLTPTEQLEDGRIVLIEPEKEYIPCTETLGNRPKGGYAGALQAHESYGTAESRWDLNGFKTLRRRVRTVQKRLKTDELQSIAEDIQDSEDNRD